MQHTAEYDDNSDAVISTTAPPAAASSTMKSSLAAVGTKKCGSRKTLRDLEGPRKSLSIREIGTRLLASRMKVTKAVDETDPVEDFDDDNGDDGDGDDDSTSGGDSDGDNDGDNNDHGYDGESDFISEGDFENHNDSDYLMEKVCSLVYSLLWYLANTYYRN